MTTAIGQSIDNKLMLDEPPAPKRTRRQEFWSLLRKNRLAIWGLATFVIFFFVALGGLLLTAGTDPIMDPAMVRLQEKLRPPMARPNIATLKAAEVPAPGIYLFGTDDLGRDVFARMLQGAWVSLTVGFVAIGISVLIGIIMGGLAGYFGERPIRIELLTATGLLIIGGGLLITHIYLWGSVTCLAALLWLVYYIVIKRRSNPRRGPGGAGLFQRNILTVDTLIMRFVDIMLCFPSFILILTVIAILPASIYNIMIVIGLTNWMVSARLVRAEFLSLREQDFVAAARALGVGNFRIIFRHMMPNAMGPVLVSATIGIAYAILAEAALSFLGFGVPPPHATWGNILSDGRRFIFDAPWLTFIPGIAILIVVLSFNLFGEGLRDVMNPRLRGRR